MSQDFILAPGEEFIQCPYNTAHQITNARIITHLNKCRKAYLKTLSVEGRKSEMALCKFNATHHVPKIELSIHEQNCSDSANFLRYLSHSSSQQKEKLEQVKEEDEDGWQCVRGRSQKNRDKVSVSQSQSQLNSFGGATSVEVEMEEDWEAESTGNQPGYDPQLKLKQEAVMYVPQGLTRSERRKFRHQVRTRHAFRNLTGEKMEFPVSKDFEAKPEPEEMEQEMTTSVEPTPAIPSTSRAAYFDMKSSFEKALPAIPSIDDDGIGGAGCAELYVREEEVAVEDGDEWPWPDTGSDIWPSDDDDFAGEDPFA